MPASFDAPDVDGNDTVEYYYADSGRSIALGDDVAMIGGNLTRQIVEYTTSPAGASATMEDTGVVHVFERSGGAWRRGAEPDTVLPGAGFDPGGYARDEPVGLGSAVDLSGDRAIVGTARDDPEGAHLFEHEDAAWERRAGFGPPPVGSSVAIDDDAALVGAVPEADSAGEAHLFERTDGAWERSRVTADGVDAGDRFGESVDLSGGVAVIGAGADRNPESSATGSAFVRGIEP